MSQTTSHNNKKYYYTRGEVDAALVNDSSVSPSFYSMNDHYGLKSYYQSMVLQNLKPTELFECKPHINWLHYDNNTERLYYGSDLGPTTYLSSIPLSKATSKMYTGVEKHHQVVAHQDYVAVHVNENGEVRSAATSDPPPSWIGVSEILDRICEAACDPTGSSCTFRGFKGRKIERYSFESASISASIEYFYHVSAIQCLTSDTTLFATGRKAVESWDKRENQLHDLIRFQDHIRGMAARDSAVVTCDGRNRFKSFDLRYLSKKDGETVPMVSYEDPTVSISDCETGSILFSPCGDYFAYSDCHRGVIKIHDISISTPLACNPIRSVYWLYYLPPFTWIDNQSLAVLSHPRLVTLWKPPI